MAEGVEISLDRLMEESLVIAVPAGVPASKLVAGNQPGVRYNSPAIADNLPRSPTNTLLTKSVETLRAMY